LLDITVLGRCLPQALLEFIEKQIHLTLRPLSTKAVPFNKQFGKAEAIWLGSVPIGSGQLMPTRTNFRNK
jgi:hypothetical protein